MHRSSLAFVFTCLVAWPGPRAQEAPHFVRGDLADLSCRVVKVRPQPLGTALLLVEVHNRGAAAAEPLVFRVRSARGRRRQPAVASVPRAAFPYAHRYGRPTPAGGVERYWLQCGSPSKSTRFEVEVEQATWHDGAALAAPEVVVGRPQQVQRTLQGESRTVSALELTNPLPWPLDVVLRVDLSQPRDGQALFGARLPASGRHELVLWSVSPETTFEPPSAWVTLVRAVRAEVVDWCVVGKGDEAGAGEAFRAAYDAWVRWKKPWPAVRGRLHLRVVADNGAVEHEGRGAFVRDERGSLSVTWDESTRKALSDEVVRSMTRSADSAFASAFATVCRPDARELLRSNPPRWVTSDTVQLRGSGVFPRERAVSHAVVGDENWPLYTLREGRIAAGGIGDSVGYVHWEWVRVGGGLAVVDRHNEGRQWSVGYGYAEVDGLVVPSFYRQTFLLSDGAVLQEESLTLDQLALDATRAAVAGAAPEGPGVAALRTAWDGDYGYPDATCDLRARFEVRTPGTDGVWLGERKLRGRLTLRGYRGLRADASSWRELEVEIDGVGTARQHQLVWALVDRFRLWRGRDFNGRAPFDSVFRYARVEAPTETGVFRLTGAPYASVAVENGHVVRMAFADGTVRHLVRHKVGKDLVVDRVVTGDEDLRVEYRRLPDGILVPAEMHFEHVFGPAWGPEDIKLQRIERIGP